MMAQKDWFRGETWSEIDRAAFYARLKRSRTAANKAQYLRIQAIHLAGAGNHEAALDLLSEMIRDYPDPLQVVLSRDQMGRSLLAVGRRDEALDEYRRSMQDERDRPNVKPGCYLDFAWEIAIGGLSHLYDEAVAVLDEFSTPTGIEFPTEVYRRAVARALIADARGDGNAAREFASAALKAAAAEHSGLRYHPDIGLVKTDPEIQRRLAALAGG